MRTLTRPAALALFLLLLVAAPASASMVSGTFTQPLTADVINDSAYPLLADVSTGDGGEVRIGGSAAVGCDSGTAVVLPGFPGPLPPAAPPRLSCSWDPGLLIEGPHLLELWLSDSSDATPLTHVAGSDITVTIDRTAPSGGSITPPATTISSSTVAIAFSGSAIELHPGILLIQRKETNIVAGACNAGGYGAFASVNMNAFAGASPWDDTGVTPGHCYQYRALETDAAGNVAAGHYTSSNEVKYPALAAVGGSFTVPAASAVVGGSSVTVSATLSPSTADGAQVKVDGTPATGCTTPTVVAGATPTITCSWDAHAIGDGSHAITLWVSDSANVPTLTQVDTRSVTVDNTAPTGGSISVTDGAISGASVPVTFVAGSDPHPGTLAVQRREAVTTAAGCNATYGSWATIATDPASSPYLDTTVAPGHCYQYQALETDAAGNAAAPHASASVVRVAPTPLIVTLTLAAGSGSSTPVYVSGSTVYVGTGTSVYSVGAHATGGTGTYYLQFPALPGVPACCGALAGDTGNVAVTHVANAGSSLGSVLTMSDSAGATGSATFDVVEDTTGPTGGTATRQSASGSSSTRSLMLTGVTDAGSGVDTTTVRWQAVTVTQHADGTCEPLGSAAWTSLAGASDSTAAASCKYHRAVVSDRVGNLSAFEVATPDKGELPESATTRTSATLVLSTITQVATNSFSTDLKRDLALALAAKTKVSVIAETQVTCSSRGRVSLKTAAVVATTNDACASGGRIAAKSRKRIIRFISATAVAGPNGKARLQVRMTKAGKAFFQRNPQYLGRRFPVAINVTIQPKGGKAVTVSKVIKVKVRKPRKHRK